MLGGGRGWEDEEGTEEDRPHRLVKHPARQSQKRRPYVSGKRKRNLRCENGSEIYASRNGPSRIRYEEEEKDEEIPAARNSPQAKREGSRDDREKKSTARLDPTGTKGFEDTQYREEEEPGRNFDKDEDQRKEQNPPFQKGMGKWGSRSKAGEKDKGWQEKSVC